METQGIKRKLTAILYADVAGYSRMTGLDEIGTHNRVMEILDYGSSTITSHGGTVLRYAGDAILAEFPSVIGAVETAVDIQTALAERNASKTENEKVEIRIGLNLGEVLLDRQEIYGEGVNLAARLEAVAKPGGVCISSAVHEQVMGKVKLEFQNGGEEFFKNIDRPVQVYHWHPGDNAAAAPLKPPDKPSIAVLPFDNMSNDPEQEFFADGITEDIITELSREKDLFVIARHSTFAYKGKSTDVRQVAQELGVKYVLEGSVRKAGGKIRLNAQLIEAETNHHVWADRWDRALEDVFEVQDELTHTIGNTLLQKFRDTDIERALRRPPKDMAAYDHYLRAFGLILTLNRDDNTMAIQEAQKALDIDPDYARAHMILGWAHIYSCWSGWADDPAEALRLGHQSALRAIACDKDDYWGHGTLAFAELFQHNHDRALAAVDQAVALNPNSADTHAMRGIILNMLGQPGEALGEMQVAVRHNPHHPYWYLIGFGRAYFLLGQYNDAIPYLERLVDAGGDILTWRALLAASYTATGKNELGQAEISTLLKDFPNTTTESIRSLVPLRDKAALDHYMALLQQAGLPD